MSRRAPLLRQVLSVLAPALALTACAGPTPETTPPGDGIFGLLPGWNEIDPGGDTVCARGAPYRFFVRPGKVNKLLIDFRGGGACWDDRTCSDAQSLFQATADTDPWVTNGQRTRDQGIYDHERRDNPFADWHHVYIPYCTGDIHWGNAATTYADGTTIHHRGAVNARAVLEWTFENVSAPEQIMVTGCSAGAYGSIMWSPHVREHYRLASVAQLADSGAGVITDTFFQDSYPSWHPETSYPTWIPGLVPENMTRLPQLYEAIGRHYPDMILSQYTTQYDNDQSFFFSAMGGGDASEWSRRMNAGLREIDASTPNFTYYVAAGDRHCILGRPEFYTLETDGVKLLDWLRQMLQGEVPDDVTCKGPECRSP